MKAAAVINRLAEYRPAPRFTELWGEKVTTLGVDEDLQRLLMDPDAIDGLLDAMPNAGAASHLHACTHTTFSCNLIESENRLKTNVIPDSIDIGVDVRTLPGETADDVTAHLQAALGDLFHEVEVTAVMNDPATISRVDTPLWDALGRSIARSFPTARPTPQLVVGFTDARVYRDMGAVAYGAGLMSPDIDAAEFGRRFPRTRRTGRRREPAPHHPTLARRGSRPARVNPVGG